MAQIIGGAGSFRAAAPGPTHWVEHLRSEHLSVGTYSICAGGDDDQEPHLEDEIYLITAGRAKFTARSAEGPVTAGSAVFVAAGEEHRFVDVSDDFAAIVVFAPPEALA